MVSLTSSMQSLSLSESRISDTLTASQLDDASTSTSAQLQDQAQPAAGSPAESASAPTPAKPRRASRPDQVDPVPWPSKEECLQVKAAKGSMYFGFFADDDVLHNMLASRYPNLRKQEPDDFFLYPAVLYLRKRFRRRDIGLHIGVVCQRVKDLNPTVMMDAKVGQKVLVLTLFEMEEESYFDRMTQKEVDEITELMGLKPAWWWIAHLMPSF